MTDIAEARALVADCATYNFGMRNADRLAHDVAPALISELEEAREVLAGADHTAAKYWRRMTEAERERDELADHLVKTGEDADRYMEERDALAAVIERAKDAGSVSEWDIPPTVKHILNSVPADVLRERDAEAWFAGYDKGNLDGYFGTSSERVHSPYADLDPYRETKEQDL